MFNRIHIIVLAGLISLCPPAESATWYVDDVTDPLEDGSVYHPFDTIQEGIDFATNNDVVLVLDGTYTGIGNRDLDTLGKAITIESETGPSNTVIDCQSAGRGFIFLSGETTNCRISGLRICNGSAMVGAGIACFSNSSPVIEDCEIVTNRAWTYKYTLTYGEPWDVYFRVETAADGNGGGVYCESSDLTLRDCLVGDNETGGNGGGICSVSNSSLTIDDCEFADNQAALARTNVTLTIGTPADPFYWVTWSNRADGKGGGIYSDEGSLVASNCAIIANVAGFGAGVYAASNSALRLEGCRVAGNNALDNSVPSVGGGVAVIKGNSEILRCFIDSNYVGAISSTLVQTVGADGDPFYRVSVHMLGGGFGGGLFLQNATSQVSDSTFMCNGAAGHGGGIYLCDNSASVFSNCAVEDNGASDSATPGTGGGVSCNNSSITAVQCTFDNNAVGQIVTTTVLRIGLPSDPFHQVSVLTAGNGFGGGFYSKNGIMRISDSTFRNNSAEGSGGGIYVSDNSDCVISDCTVLGNGVPDNATPGTGGGIACRDSSFTALHSDVFSNGVGHTATTTITTIGKPYDEFYQVTTTTEGNGLGGGCFAQRSSVTITACRVVGNLSAGDGGGLYLTSNRTCQVGNTILHANEAVRMTWRTVTTVTVENCQTTVGDYSVITEGSGGGVFCTNTPLAMRSCMISRNRAGAAGGGIFLSQSVASLLRNSFLVDNEAGLISDILAVTWWPRCGGDGLTASATVARAAAGLGAGIYCENSSPLIRSSTVAGNFGTNTADGLYCGLASTSRIVNSIFWSNRIYSVVGSEATASYSCIEGGVPVTGVISNNPRLTADWRLTYVSPCIDAGTLSAAPATDYDDEARWDHPAHPNLFSIVDIGADEFVDTDRDTLPDFWEVTWFGGLALADAFADSDADELNNRGEYNNATFPILADSDGDRVPDGWELQYAQNPRVNDSTDDPDWDGFTTLMEYIADTNPTNALDYLWMTDVGMDAGSNAVIRWQTSSNRVYAIETSPDTIEPWNLATNVPGNGAEASFTNDGVSSGVQFLRIKAQLP